MSYIYPSILKGKTQYKVYFVYESNKIYLGTYSSMEIAQKALEEAKALMKAPKGPPDLSFTTLSYQKIVCLSNFRDHQKYIKNPIYLYPTYFHYYLSKDCILIFDAKDLLYFSTYRIYKRGHYLYTQDSISQQNILSRFHIPNYSVAGKDYFFKNGNPFDFRAENLIRTTHYKGVKQTLKHHKPVYVASIYTDTPLIIGHYASEIEAAIAYNKAIDLLHKQNTSHHYTHHKIPYLTDSEYLALYNQIEVSPRLFYPTHSRKRIFSAKKLRGMSQGHMSYKVHIGHQGQQFYLGTYPTEKRAAQAYNYASIYLYGKQGHLNEVSPLIDEKDSVKIAAFLKKYHLLKSNDRQKKDE